MFRKADRDGLQFDKVIPRTVPPADTGLSDAEAADRLQNGYGNTAMESATKTVWQIVEENVFTYFNLIFCVLAACILAVKSYNNLVFMPVIIINTLIGIIQELRSKRVVDKLSLVNAPKATLIREGREVIVPTDKAVRDDIAVFSAGQQVYADAVVVSGTCQTNEALVTGEADEITKNPGDTLMSGSFVVAGECRACLDRVGADSFASRLTLEAKKTGKKRQSVMMTALNRLLQVIGVIIIPLGVLMYIQQTRFLGRSVAEGVVSTVAAVIGMIPEGLYLLVSVALVIGIMRLARKKTLVHEMGCIETLARVDVLCVDKTGTITENKMTVQDVVPLCEDRFSEDGIRLIMSDYVGNMTGDNETMAALRRHFAGDVMNRAVKTLQFTSATKYGGITFSSGATYLLGAPEMILTDRYEQYRDVIEKYSSLGCRVLLLALYSGDIAQKGINGEVTPVSLILLANKIREEAPATFRFFQKQGVKIIVISGDNPTTVSQVALEAGIRDADRYVDASTLGNERKIKRAVNDYVVFGRVTPGQKRKLIRALKEAGHTVAMTGDGVNDILAMKDSDVSIAMASGSDVASQVAQLVLMKSNFSALPSVVMEGRRVINNIERSASLYLVKNLFSFLLAVTSLIFTLTYPVSPSQLSLVNVATIGMPAFILALEQNYNIVRGGFMKNVLLRALPAGITDFVAVVAAVLLCKAFGFSNEELGTMSTMILAAVGFMMLIIVCWPFTSLRKAMLILMVCIFAFCVILLPWFFTLSPLSWKPLLVMFGIIILAAPLMYFLTRLLRGPVFEKQSEEA
ncbi:MAG: cation-translocating P-type ATPase [Oscillospiraceae bacterium]|nr:cation-translocating P-type ATPase [Oscillospiraceae bacterium]